MLTMREILLGAVLPAGVTLVIALLSLRLPSATWGRFLAIVGIASGWMFAYALLPGQIDLTRFPPREADDWLFFAMPVLVLVAWVNGLARPPFWSRCMVVAGFAAGLMWLMLLPIVTYEWSNEEAAAWIAGCAIVTTISWALTESAASRTAPWASAVAWTIIGMGAALVLALSATITLAQLAGALTATCGAIALVALFSRNIALDRGPALVVILPLAGLLIAGHFYASATLRDVLLVLAGPVGLWIGSLLRRRWGRHAAWAEIGLTAIPVLIAVGFVVVQYLSDEPDLYGY